MESFSHTPHPTFRTSNRMTGIRFSAIFVEALGVTLAVRLWLSRRQIAYVSAHRNAVPAAFASRIALAAHQKAADYTMAKQRLGIVETIVDAVVLVALTLGGGLALLFGWTERIDAAPLWLDVILLVAIGVVGGLVSLPFSWCHTFRIEERFGFNRTTPKLWLTDIVKGVLVAIVLGLPLIVLALWLMRNAGALWWLWVWLAWLVFQVLMLVLFPTVIAPLFNKFSPLPAGAARERIEQLLARCDFAARGLFVVDGSRRSGHGNAYFTGFGRARRVVFFDTLLARLSPDEVEAVLAHELGHFKLRHVAKRVAWSAIVSLAFLALLAWLATMPWFYAGLGIPPVAVGAAMTRPGIAFALFIVSLASLPFVPCPFG